MAKREWAPAINTFLSSSENNYFKAHRMSIHLDSLLENQQSDPAILPLYNYYHPIHVSFENAYSIWDSQWGLQIGSTLGVKEVLQNMTKNLNTWISQIHVAGIAKGTPEYISLFGKGRYPFQNGSIMNRIIAVEVLGLALDDYPTLAAVKTQVDNYAQQLKDARENQSIKKITTRNNSSDLEDQRIAMCKAQYYVLGGLMQKYVDEPQSIQRYFLVQEIRNSQQKHFTGRAAANNNKQITKRTLKPNKKIRLNNVGLTPLQFYFAESDYGTPVGNIILVQSEADEHYTFADFNAPNGKYLFVKNNEKLVDGHFEVTIG